MGSAACRGAGPERAMGPESVPLYCLAVMGANPARLWPLAWGTESRRRRGRTAVIDQGRWRRVRGMGSLRGSVWVRDFGQIPKELKTRHFGHAAKGDGPPFRAGHRQDCRPAYPDEPPRRMICLSGQVAGEVCYSLIQAGGRRLDGSPLKAGCRRVVTHLPGQATEKVDDMPGLAPGGR